MDSNSSPQAPPSLVSSTISRTDYKLKPSYGAGAVWPLAGILGPIIGVQLSNLGTKYPAYFSYQFLLKYPYFAPNAFCAILVLAAFVIAYLVLKETAPSKREGLAAPMNTPTSTYGIRNLLGVRKIRAITTSSFFLAFLSSAFSLVFWFFCYFPISHGGLGFSNYQVRSARMLSDVLMVSAELVLLPTLLRRMKPHHLYNASMRIWPLAFLLLPCLHLIARPDTTVDSDDATRVNIRTVLLWTGIVVVMICTRLAMLANTTNLILVRDACPSPACLGAANGISLFTMSASRCLSPLFTSWIFSFSLPINIFGWFPLWVVILMAISGVGCYFSERMVKLNETGDTQRHQELVVNNESSALSEDSRRR
ncbi:MFS domain-containing protein [Mycena kentingensis (nom. inval.)]|nr:MFS domain-containing protein [Mycena kentingensis (nom. inval.)]